MALAIRDRKNIISCYLVPDRREHSDPEAVAKRALWLLEQLAAHLTPLIGETGFQTLYSRSIHLTLPHCPGFTVDKNANSTDALFKRLKQDFDALERSIVEQCSLALLCRFIDLVASMIGDAVLEQILQSAWSPSSVQPILKESRNGQ